MLQIDSRTPLHDGHTMPLLGLGVFQMGSAEDTVSQVRAALELGYRHIDTARGYGNEEAVGQGIRESGIPREEVFVTTKIMPNDFHRATEAIEESRQRLDLGPIDLYLIHWPVREGTEATWKTLCQARDAGKIKSVGVSNFTVRRYQEQFLPHVEELPVANQIERHPRFAAYDIVAFDKERDILTIAYSPLARGAGLDDPALTTIAETHGKTPAQVSLRWQLQQGVAVIPKTSTPARLQENADLFDFALTDAEMARIDALDKGADGSVITWRPEEAWF